MTGNQTGRGPHCRTHWGEQTEGTDNQSDRGTLGTVYCTERSLATSWGEWGWAQTTRQTGETLSGAHGDTGALSTVYIEGTDNQSDRGHIVGHSGAVNCTFRGHRQSVSQGAHDSATTPGSDQKTYGCHTVAVRWSYGLAVCLISNHCD